MAKRGEKAKFGEREESAFAYGKRGGKYSTPKRRRERAKASDFLLPKERKFPYKIGGKISCKLLLAAIRRGGQHGYPEVQAKARKLYSSHCQPTVKRYE